MNYKLITTVLTLFLIGSVVSTALQPGVGLGYGYGYGYEEYDYDYGYGYGTTTDTTTSSDTTTTTDSAQSDTADVPTEVVEEVSANDSDEPTTDQTTVSDDPSDGSCALDTPHHLKARHQNNRVVLRWRGSNAICPSATLAGYILRITTKRDKLVFRSNILGQSHYTIRHKKLKMNKTYLFTVRAVLETGEKTEWSKEKRFKITSEW